MTRLDKDKDGKVSKKEMLQSEMAQGYSNGTVTKIEVPTTPQKNETIPSNPTNPT